MNSKIDSASLIVPFQISDKNVLALFFTWLAEDENTPDNILDQAKILTALGIYMPFYFLGGKYHADCTASIGYDKQEEYPVQVKKTKTENDKQIEYTETEIRTRTVKDWKPFSHSFNGSFTKIGFASESTNQEYMSFCEGIGWKREDIKKYDITYVKGFSIENFKESYETILKTRIIPQIESHILHDIKKQLPGDHNKDIKYSYSISNSNKTSVFMPFWFIKYSYHNTTYQCSIDGQGKRKVFGKRPLDQNRIKLFKSLFIPFKISIGLFIILLVIMFASNTKSQPIETNLLKPSLIILFISTIAFGIYGICEKNRIKNKSMQYKTKCLHSMLNRINKPL